MDIDDFENPRKAADVSASSPEPEITDFRIERKDWTLFALLGELPKKAGVPINLMRRLCLKELTDNALDAPGATWATIEEAGAPGNYVIENDGDGFDGTPDEVARLFSINRPLSSSKLIRKPQRGAFGNGLRVVAGALIASGGGSLAVTTRNQRLTITPLEDGGADVIAEPADYPRGTIVEISFGPNLPKDPCAMIWAEHAVAMNEGGKGYVGNPSLHWFDAETFYALMHASVRLTVRKFMEQFDGCSGAKASEIAGRYMQMSCKDMARGEATELLLAAREATTEPNIRRLGMVGDLDYLPKHRAFETGSVELGADEPQAEIPFVVEAWAEELTDKDAETEIDVYVNRTPITGKVTVLPDRNDDPSIRGCNLFHNINAPTKSGKWKIALNITAPYVPSTNESKEPDLLPFAGVIVAALSKALKKAHRDAPKKGPQPSQKEVVIDNLDAAIAKASGDGQYRFSQRQLLYALRPIVMREIKQELKTENFTSIITDYEAEHGDIPDMFRDNRGALYHPHMGEGDIPVGTLMVEGYERPPWAFNKIVYIEKQGFFEILKAVKWPEHHDCALLTSKGYSSRAIRDLIDHLAGHDEPVQVFCVHDADSAGTMIMQNSPGSDASARRAANRGRQLRPGAVGSRGDGPRRGKIQRIQRPSPRRRLRVKI